jgi:hypothetical protein
MANCSQINNTSIIGTSAVKYDSTPLPCTDVSTCDGLNTILAKFDAVICEVKADVDSITENVINLTEDVMVITEDITNIYSQLNVCCPTTTTTTTLPPTTTTTTTLPVTTTTTSSSSSTSTTTTSSSSTTTTTTTVVSSCLNYEVNVSVNCPGKPFAAFEYTDCYGDVQIAEVGTGDLPTFCVLSTAPTPTFSCGEGDIYVIGECITTTTTSTTIAPTTTTTTSIFCDCYVYEVTITEQQLLDSDNNRVYVYVDEACVSNSYYTFEFTEAGTETICVSRNNTFILQYIEIESEITSLPDPVKLNQCCTTPPPSTTTTTTLTPTTTTTTTLSGLRQGLISSTSHPTDACSLILDTDCWVSNTAGMPGSEVVSVSSVVYTDAGGTIPFIGDDNFYHIELELSSVPTNCQINGTGNVSSGVGICS